MESFRHLFQYIDFDIVCDHARRFHNLSPQEILGESWIYDRQGKTQDQLFSRLRREFGPDFSGETLENIDFHQQVVRRTDDPTDFQEEEEREKNEEKEEFAFGETDTGRLAAALGITRRRAQQLVRRRREQILAPGGQSEFSFWAPEEQAGGKT